MAWQAKLATFTTRSNDDVYIYVPVTYYDDSDPGTILHSIEFQFEVGTAKADAQNAIIAEGQRKRALLTKVATLKGQIPDNTIIAIP